MNAKRVSLAAMLAAVVLTGSAFGDSARQAVRQGNRMYEQGQFNEAMKGYDEALQDSPEAVVPRFNKANSYYRLDDLDAAMDLYREVAAESRDMPLVAKAKYNAGNCYFQEGCKQKDSNLQKAVGYMETAISYWRSVLELEPDNEKAARNIEVARLTIKDIIDQINKQKEQQQKQAEAAEKLKELLEKQRALSAKTGETNEKAAKGDITAEQAGGEYGEQSKEQAGIRQETWQAAKDLMSQDPNTAQSPQMQEAVAELDMAAASQENAETKLNASEGKSAKESEDEAAQHIENALKALSSNDQNQPKQGQDQQQQGEEQQQEQQMSQQDPNQPQDPNEGQEQEGESEEMEEQQQAPDATAQEILDKEKQEREQRQMMQRGGYSPVEKDW